MEKMLYHTPQVCYDYEIIMPYSFCVGCGYLKQQTANSKKHTLSKMIS